MLTPSDVEQKTFHTSLRGYDLDEVDDFLDEVVSTLRELETEMAAARATGGGTQAPPQISSDESAVGRALIAAQTTADQIIADARAEAERILEEARSESGKWIEERELKKAEAAVEMADLAEHVAGVRTQLAVLATAVADRLDEMDAALSSESGEGDEEASSSEPDSHDTEEADAMEDDEEDEEPLDAADESDADGEDVEPSEEESEDEEDRY